MVADRHPTEPTALACPACGGANASEAVFCVQCHKALGEFKYALEELRAEARWHETLAARVAATIGQPHFIIVHALWFAFWVAANTGAIAVVGRFDEFPFQLLGTLLAMEAVFLTGVLLIDDRREDARAAKLAELDYEVNVRTHRQLAAIDATLHAILVRLERAGPGALPDGDPREEGTLQ